MNDICLTQINSGKDEESLCFVWVIYSIDQLLLTQTTDDSGYSLVYELHRGYNMSGHMLLTLLNELGKEIKCEAMPSILSFFCKKFRRFKNRQNKHLNNK